MTKVLQMPISSDPFGTARIYGFNDDFLDLEERNHQFILPDEDAGVDTAATIIFNPTFPVHVTDVVITSDGTSSSAPDDTDPSVWTVTDGAVNMVTQTYNSTTAFPADNVQTSLGTITPNLGGVPAGGRVELAVTNTTNANLKSIVVNVVYTTVAPNWAVIAPDDGFVSVADGVKGIIALAASDATEGDNDEIYLVSNKELFKFLDNKPIVCEIFSQFTEANTDDANVMFGLMDGVAADSLADDGAGPKSSYSGCVFYKVDGGTVWVCESSLSTTQITNTTKTTAGGSSFQRLRIEVQPVSSTEAVITFFIDGAQARDTSTNLPISHRLTYTSATEMQLVAAVKNGSTNVETLNIDSMGCFALR